MKTMHKMVFLLGILGIACINLYGQINLKSTNDVIEHRVQNGTQVTLQIQQYRGSLQWQQSVDGTNWINWDGKTGAQLQFTANVAMFIRVAVSSENCSPVYSETVHLIILTGPVVTTTEVTRIAATEAYSGGKVTNDGGKAVTEWGVCWSTNENPTISDSKIIDEEAAPEEFIGYIKGLIPNTTYHVRAFATNADGTGYGNQFTFKTLEASGTFTDTRDSRPYKWIYLGQQKWMAENLAWLPSVSPSATGSETEKYYYVFGYEGSDLAAAKATANYTLYGALYNWTAAMDGATSSNLVPSGVKGACPTGWHVPSQNEWSILRTYLAESGFGFGGDGYDVGKSVASTTGWTVSGIPGDVGNNQAGNNSSGFNAYPAGGRDVPPQASFVALGTQAFFGSSTLTADNKWMGTGLSHISNTLIMGSGYFKSVGWSVRCICD